MNENEKLNHLRNNKDKTDYIKVYDRTLKKEKYVKLDDIEYNGKPLREQFDEYDKLFNELTTELEKTNKSNKEMKELLDKIWGGLNVR